MPVYVTAGTAKMFKINDVFLTGKSRIKNLKIITDTICIGDFRITPYIIDHSAYDACALLIEIEDKLNYVWCSGQNIDRLACI